MSPVPWNRCESRCGHDTQRRFFWDAPDAKRKQDREPPSKEIVMTPMESLIASGTKVWLDSIDPDALDQNTAWGATGATSNPIIIADLIKTGRFDSAIERLLAKGADDEALAWQLT